MRTGVWLVGARGSVAVTSMVGALALRAGLAEPIGCVCELPALRNPALPGLRDLVFGGHDIVTTPLSKRAEALASAGVLPGRLVAAVLNELHKVEDDLRPAPVGRCQAEVPGGAVCTRRRARRSDHRRRRRPRGGRPGRCVGAPLPGRDGRQRLGLDVLLGASPGRPVRALPAAATVAAHTYTVTALSRREVSGADRRLPLATLAGTAAVAAAAPLGRRLAQKTSPT